MLYRRALAAAALLLAALPLAGLAELPPQDPERPAQTGAPATAR